MRHLLSRYQGAVLLLASLTFASPAIAQNTCVAGQGHWGGGPPEAVEHYSGGGQQLLAIGNGAMLSLYDSSTPQAPVKLGEVLVGDPVRSIDISPDGLTAAVSDHRRRVHLIDISNRAAPILRGSYATTGSRQPYGMDIVGTRLYVAVRQLGLIVLNISNLDAPVLLGQSGGTVTDYVFDVEIRGNYAYLAQRADGVLIINITNPAVPAVAGSHAASTGAADMHIVGNRAYVTRGNDGVDILDLTNATSPTRIGTFAANSGTYLFDTELISSTHAAVSSFAGTLIYSISTPASATLVSTIGNNHYRIATQGGYAFISASGGADPVVRILNLVTPTSPIEAGTLAFDGPSLDVHVGGGQMLVANGQRGLVVLNAVNPLAPMFAGRVEFPDDYINVVERVNGVAAVGTYGKVALVDTSNPAVPSLIANIDAGSQFVGDLVASGNRLYVAAGAGGVLLFDVTTPASPQTVWQWMPPIGLAQRVALDGNLAYVGLNQDLRVLQLGNPAPPVEIDDLQLPSRITEIVAASGFVYVSTEVSGVRVFDHRVPGTMVEIANINMGLALPTDIAIEGTRLYIAANGNAGLRVYNISNPFSPLLIEQRDTPGEPTRVAARNGVVALADYSNGVRTYICDAAAAERIFGNGFDTP